jgi:hypothetical protein
MLTSKPLYQCYPAYVMCVECPPAKEYSIGEVVEAGDFKRCAAMAFKALEHDKDCGQPKVTRGQTCGFWVFGDWSVAKPKL